MKNTPWLLLIGWGMISAMDSSDVEYTKKISFLEAYMASSFIFKGKEVIVNHFEDEAQQVSLSLKSAATTLVCADKTLAHAAREGKFPELEEAQALLGTDPQSLTKKNAYYLQLLSYSEFVMGYDLQGSPRLSEEKRAMYCLLRNNYKTAWISRCMRDINAAAACHLHAPDVPYVPLLKRIECERSHD